MQTMYAGKANSIPTTLAADINAIQTTIDVVDASVLPAAPNIATIGNSEDAETILYTGFTSNTLTGVTRGLEGAAKTWTTGDLISRRFTNRDYGALKQNIEDHDASLASTTSGMVNVAVGFGAVGDMIADDTIPLNNAITKARNENKTLYVPSNYKLLITEDVDMSFIPHIQMEGSIKLTNVSSITCGQNEYTPSVHIFNQVYSDDLDDLLSGVRTKPVLILKGDYTPFVDVRECFYFQLFASRILESQRCVVGGNIHLGNIIRFDLYSISDSHLPEDVAWVNDNNFFGGKFSQINIGGDDITSIYHHDNNVFYKPIMEKVGTHPFGINIKQGMHNIFYDVRTEGTGGNNFEVRFGLGTKKNIIYNNFVGNSTALNTNNVVEDLGQDNVYTSHLENIYTEFPLMILNNNTLNVNDVHNSNDNIVSVGIRKFKVTSSQSLRFIKNIDTSSIKRFAFKADASLFNLRVKCYDASGTVITSIDPYPFTWYAGWVYDGANQRYNLSGAVSQATLVLNANVKSIDLTFCAQYLASGFGYASYANLYAYAQKKDLNYLENLKSRLEGDIYVATMPITKCRATKGKMVSTSSGIKSCTHYKERYLTANAATSATVITTDAGSDASAIGAVGDIIGVELNDGATHWTTIASLSGYNVTLTNALPSAANINNLTACYKWV